MSGVTLVTLKDGSQVPEPLFTEIQANLQMLYANSSVVLFDLFEKCHDPEYIFPPNSFFDSMETLKKCKLIDDQENIAPDIKKIVLNSLLKTGLQLRLINPIKNKFSKKQIRKEA